MHDVSNAINILDPSNTIDGKICGAAANWVTTNANESDGKCHAGNGSTSNTGSAKKFSDMFGGSNITGKGYPEDATKKMGDYPKTSAKISSDVSNLNRDQKGIVSSAFAKAHEGAEIVEIRSISTTSGMVNACYDVLTDGLPVAPYGCAGIGVTSLAVGY